MIDVIRTSTSRPSLLEKSHYSFMNKVHYSDGFRFLLHEDVIKSEESIKCFLFAKNTGYKISLNLPPIGHGCSLQSLILFVNTKYFFALEDDWEFLRDIDLNLIVNLMENNPDINQITFHKRPIMGQKGNFEKRQIERDGINLVVSPHWNMLPSLCRTSFILPYFTKPLALLDSNFVWTLNKQIKQLERIEDIRDCEWTQKNMGTYFFGKHGEGTFIFHLGGGYSVREGQWK